MIVCVLERKPLSCPSAAKGDDRKGALWLLHHDFQQGQSRMDVLISFVPLPCFPSEWTSQTPLGAAFPSGQDSLLNLWSLQGHRWHAADPLAGAAAAGAALAERHSGWEAGPAHGPAGCRGLPGLRSLGLHDRPQPGHWGWPEPVVKGVLQFPSHGPWKVRFRVKLSPSFGLCDYVAS